VKKLLLLALLPMPAFAIHVVSDPYPPTATQPDHFILQCGTNATFNSAPDVANGNRLYQDLSVVNGSGPGAQCTVVAVGALGETSTSVPFAIPVGPAAPANVTVTK
jgi:hypothetical protein